MKKILLAGLFSALIATESNAAVVYDPGTTYETTALTGFLTTGDMMDGMTITAFLSSGAAESFVWYDIGNLMGGIYGTGWYLRVYGDSYLYDWILLADVFIDRIIIDAGPGNSVFDILWQNNLNGTAGSARGITFSVVSGLSNANVTATYRDMVALTGSDPVGDLWKVLDISFHAPYSGYLRFKADTDNIAIPGDLDALPDPDSAPVPEPSTLILIGSGLGIIAISRGVKKSRICAAR